MRPRSSPGRECDGIAFGRWYRTLPDEHRVRPAARFAAGIELQARAPLEALSLFEEAAIGFRACGDVDGEVAVLHQDGQVRWWANDLDGLLRLYQRVVTLAAAGSAAASMVAAVGTAAIAHLGGDSDGTLKALAGIDDRLVGGWSPTIHWLRHVAYRRDGDLLRAEARARRCGRDRHRRTSARSSSLPGCEWIGWPAGSTTSARSCPTSNNTTAPPRIVTCTAKRCSSSPARWRFSATSMPHVTSLTVSSRSCRRRPVPGACPATHRGRWHRGR